MTETDPAARNVRLCFQCGSCNASCPIHRLTDEFNPVRISRTILMGSTKELIEGQAIWLCAKCYFCTERCPRNVNFSDVIIYLQNLAFKEGKAPAQQIEAAKNVLETGWVYKLGFGQRLEEASASDRTRLGLPPLPKANEEAVQKILERLGFTKLLKR